MELDQIAATSAYAFAHFGVNGTYEDYTRCFPQLSERGFRNFYLEVLEDEQVDLFTPARLDHFRELGEQYKIGLPIFTTYFAENDLVSLSPERRKRGMKKFRFCVEAAERLGSTIMNLASEFPPELVSEYRPEYVHSPAGRFWIPQNVPWQSIWDAQVEVMRECADLSAEHDMKLSLEPRTNCIISTTDSFLRLADQVARPNFGCSLDLMHAHYNHEDIPTAIKKLGSLLIDLQVCDSDGQALQHLPIGEGNIDFTAVIHALDDIAFKGILGLEIYYGNDPDGAGGIDQSYKNSRIALEELIKTGSSTQVMA